MKNPYARELKIKGDIVYLVSQYGYPDESFLERCKAELRLKNVYFASEEEKQAGIAEAKSKNVVQTYS